MNYRSTLMTAGAAVALAGLANAQVNGDYDHNWASLSNGPAAVLLDPATFAFGVSDSVAALGDSIRLCYSIDVTQGGRNFVDAFGNPGQSYISWFDVAQGFGGANPDLGVKIGQTSFMARTSTSLDDDACLSDIFVGTGNAFLGSPGQDINLGELGLIAGTGGYSITAGFFWDIAFEFIGSNLPSISNQLGADPVSTIGAAPMLAHLVYEIQAPADGAVNVQYFLGSTSERNGTNVAGGVTNGYAPNFGFGIYGADPITTAAVTGNRVTIADQSSGTPTLVAATPVGLLGGTGGELEWLGAVALQTPVMRGVNSGNAGGGGADWVVTGGTLSTIDVRIIDKLSGGAQPTSGAAISNPNLFFNSSFLLWSATPAVNMTQRPLSWDDLGGALPPKGGSYILPTQITSRAGAQAIAVNFDGTTAAFLNLGLSLLSSYTGALDPNLDAGGVGDLFDLNPTSGTSSFATGPLAISTPLSASAAGVRLGLNSVGIQVDLATGGALNFTEVSNALTGVLQ